MPAITDLPELIAKLPADRHARFERLFDVQRLHGELLIPDTMRDWTARRFGAVEDVEHQTVVRVTNTVTWEGAIFNPMRARRPLQMRAAAPPPNGDALFTAGDIFADPPRSTAVDTYGRVCGEYCVTTSNIARWDRQCSVLIFNEPDPFAFKREHLRDYFRTTLQWAQRAHEVDPAARYLVWVWNGGTAGGASIPHAHAQLGLGQSRHYAMVEGLRHAALGYRATSGTNYFDDLLAAHDDVGLGFATHGLRGFVYLAAARAKDTWIVGNAFDDTLADALHDTLRALIERAGVRGFDVGVLMPPVFETSRDPQVADEDWSGFPVIARIVDRGHPDALSSDVGAMDIFVHRIIADDPYRARAIL